ncbi:hypothetical protein VFPBJ_02956 [Purpureocillium lilacinum]|uniref:Uncharacterized protein n=1 Tax=Purpureocillium lilacinum TaxID=33203 RepID=A0A179H391_PURLI|nr:hypothetical protein VFPBJ_02956 [Purpureocillium lilacinum]
MSSLLRVSLLAELWSVARASESHSHLCLRFDGRTIRVDKASDNGPRGGYGGGRGGGGGFGGRGGYSAPMPYGVPPQGPGYAVGAPQMYAPVAYGRGYPPPQPGYGVPPQGESPEAPTLGRSDRRDERR